MKLFSVNNFQLCPKEVRFFTYALLVVFDRTNERKITVAFLLESACPPCIKRYF